MAENDNNTGSRFELSTVAQSAGPGNVATLPGQIPAELLERHVLWYCQLRWLIILILALFGALSYVPGLFSHVGLRAPLLWPLGCAGILVVMNAAYLSHQNWRVTPGRPKAWMTNLWLQIIFDLLVLTAVVHFAGTRETPTHLAYMFHILLACIFMSCRMSLMVTLIACAFYSLCVIAELYQILPLSSIYQASAQVETLQEGTFPFAISMISTQITWLVVWLLASHLVTMVRARDIALRETHQAFLKEREEKARQSQVATNELKALFAAIHANAQVLLSGHCGVLSDQVLDVALRIASRSQRLALEIQDMLHLIQLDSPSQIVQAPTRVELCGLVQRIVTQMEPEAQARHISITVQFDEQPLPVGGVADQIEMLLLHLATNAVIYSFDGGVVEISGCREPDGMMHLTIRDHGLGIQAEKIPRIFDDYYRTGEAVRHCRESTGLGLAIVRRIAVSHRIRVVVTSQPGQGTLFDLFFPAFEAASEAAGTSHI